MEFLSVVMEVLVNGIILYIYEAYILNTKLILCYHYIIIISLTMLMLFIREFSPYAGQFVLEKSRTIDFDPNKTEKREI